MMSQLLRNQQHSINSCEAVMDTNVWANEEFDQEQPNGQEEEIDYVGTQGNF